MKEHIVYYQQLLERDPDNVEAHLRLGALWRSLHRHDLAVSHYAAAARHLAREGFLLEAIAACKAIFEMEPQHTETQLFLASLYARQPAGASARVAQPAPRDLPAEDDEIILLEPSQAVQEISEHELNDALRSSGTTASAEHDALNLDEDLDDLLVEEGEEGDDLDLLTTAELPPLTRDTPPPGLSFHDPDRVLRRALNLSVGWEEAPQPAPATTESGDRWRRPDTGARPLPPRPGPSRPQTEETTRVASIFTANTVIGAPTGAPPSADTRSTRVERPRPGAAPALPDAPDPHPVAAAAPSYDRYEVISPAALSVTRRDVPDTPLFSRLSPMSFMELLRRIDLRRVPSGEAIIDEVRRPLGLFIVVNGSVEVLRTTEDGTPRLLATMGRGEFFGEFELLTGRSHSAVVRALDAADLLHISDEVIADLAEKDPSIWDILWDFYHQRLLNNLLATSPIFRDLTPDARARLGARFEHRFIDPGQIITRRGERGAGLYLILAGSVVVVDPDQAGRGPVAELHAGDFFGAISAVTDQPAAVQVQAADECTLLLLPREDLRAALAPYPAAQEALRRLASSRMVQIGKTGYSRIGVPK